MSQNRSLVPLATSWGMMGWKKRVFKAYIPEKQNGGRPRSRWDGTVKEAVWINGEGQPDWLKTDMSFIVTVREATL